MPTDSADPRQRGAVECGVQHTTVTPMACSCTPSARPVCIAVRPVPAVDLSANGLRFRYTRGRRPCRLPCLPALSPGSRDDANPWVDKIRRACVYLSNVEGDPSLATLAARLGGSPYHLQRNFKRLVGVTPRELRGSLSSNGREAPAAAGRGRHRGDAGCRLRIRAAASSNARCRSWVWRPRCISVEEPG